MYYLITAEVRRWSLGFGVPNDFLAEQGALHYLWID
jgi:hypothetical protein